MGPSAFSSCLARPCEASDGSSVKSLTAVISCFGAQSILCDFVQAREQLKAKFELAYAQDKGAEDKPQQAASGTFVFGCLFRAYFTDGHCVFI